MQMRMQQHTFKTNNITTYTVTVLVTVQILAQLSWASF